MRKRHEHDDPRRQVADRPANPALLLIGIADRETAPRAGLGPRRLAQLVGDLRLTPEQRVREAERTARASRPRNAVHIQGAIGFDDFNDYLAWKRLEELDR